MLGLHPDCPEISDAIVSYDLGTGERLRVIASEVKRTFTEFQDRMALRIIDRMPKRDGVLDPVYVDDLLVRTHCEMQRMSEEFQHGMRVAELLIPLLRTLRAEGVGDPVRIVDIGCGTGYAIRWLALTKALGENVELIGADLNAALVEEANRLAQAESLECRFVTANAFGLDHPADIYMSTGILHHFRGVELARLFKQHNLPDTRAFVHFDFHPTPFAPLGSWLFHAVRMREPLAKHDGVLSAVRAYKPRVLLEAARAELPEFISAVYGTQLWGLPIPRVFHSLVGIRAQYRPGFLNEMGRRIALLGCVE